MWTFRWMEVLSQDFRYAMRSLRRNSGFAILVSLTLALGIGATTAIFSVFDAVVLRPLPYPEPSQLVRVIGTVRRDGVEERRGASRPDYADWRDQSRSFTAMAMYENHSFVVHGDDGAEQVRGEYVAHSYFEILGVRPILGRTFLPEEDAAPLRDAVVVLSSGLWRRLFDGDPAVLGRVVRLNDRNYTVTGVLPDGFRGVTDTAELWAPTHMEGTPAQFHARGSRGPSVLARLKANVSLTQAQAEIDEICKRLEQAYPLTNEGRGAKLSPLDEEIFGSMRRPLGVLLAAVGLVLLIACTNVANLLLVRSEARQREMAARAALGAGRARMLAQLAVESGLLALLGAAGGLLAAHWGVRALLAASPVTFPSYVTPSLDLRVLLFALALTCGVGILLGLAPAVHLRTLQLHDVFKQSSHQSSGSHRGRWFRHALVIAEVALAMLLLVGAGLLMRSLQQVMDIRLGYDPSRLLTMRVSVPGSSSAPDAQPAIHSRGLLEEIAGLPGVEAAALGSDSPLTSSSAIGFAVEGHPAMTGPDSGRAYVHYVTPDFFQALGMRLIAGRTFAEAELREDANLTIVSESLAKRYWPGENPIGKRIQRLRDGEDTPWLTVVGVVNETKYRGLPDNPTSDPDLFLPFAANQNTFTLLVRSSNEPSSLIHTVQSVLRDSDPAIVTYAVNTMGAMVAGQTSQRRFTSWLMGVFAGAALLLATIGIYGVVSYTVTQRTQEIGVRMALGAARSDVLRLVTGGGMGLVACGLALGGAAALGLSQWIGSLLYGVQPGDPLTFVAAGCALMAVAFLATLAPGFRAMRVAPARALRDE